MKRWILFAALAVPMLAQAEPLTLLKKAEVFQHDMEARFLLEGQALCKLKRPVASRDFVAYNMPDNAYMTGIYVGTLAMKYAVTGAEEDRRAALKSLGALHLLCGVSGKPGLLARAAWPVGRPMEDDGVWRVSADGKYRWRGDVSTDQVDGVLFGFAHAYDLVADAGEKARIAEDVGALVRHILDNDLRIVGYDGRPTRWGRYFPQYVKLVEPMNALLFLQAAKVAHRVTQDPRFEQAYRTQAVERDYAEMALRARKDGDPTIARRVNHSDDVLLFLAYEPLLRYESDGDLHAAYVESLKRAWEGGGRYPGVKPEANPLFAFLAAKNLIDDSMVAAAMENLRCFPLDMKWNSDTIARYEAAFGFTHDPAPSSAEPKAGAPLLTDRRPKTWSAWVEDPYQPRVDDRGQDSAMEFNGHDYLLAYWLGRHYGYIDAHD